MSRYDYSPVALGLALRDARRACDQTQSQVAEAIGLAPEAYGRIERGLNFPRSDTLRRLVLALGVSADELLGVPASGLFRKSGDSNSGSAVASIVSEISRKTGLAEALVVDHLRRLIPFLCRVIGHGGGPGDVSEDARLRLLYSMPKPPDGFYENRFLRASVSPGDLPRQSIPLDESPPVEDSGADLEQDREQWAKRPCPVCRSTEAEPSEVDAAVLRSLMLSGDSSNDLSTRPTPLIISRCSGCSMLRLRLASAWLPRFRSQQSSERPAVEYRSGRRNRDSHRVTLPCSVCASTVSGLARFTSPAVMGRFMTGTSTALEAEVCLECGEMKQIRADELSSVLEAYPAGALVGGGPSEPPWPFPCNSIQRHDARVMLYGSRASLESSMALEVLACARCGSCLGLRPGRTMLALPQMGTSAKTISGSYYRQSKSRGQRVQARSSEATEDLGPRNAGRLFVIFTADESKSITVVQGLLSRAVKGKRPAAILTSTASIPRWQQLSLTALFDAGSESSGAVRRPEKNWKQALAAEIKLSSAPLRIVGVPSRSLGPIVLAAREIRLEMGGLDVLVVDSPKMLDAPPANASVESRLGDSLRYVTQESGALVVVQLSLPQAEAPPTLTDLLTAYGTVMEASSAVVSVGRNSLKAWKFPFESETPLDSLPVLLDDLLAPTLASGLISRRVPPGS